MLGIEGNTTLVYSGEQYDVLGSGGVIDPEELITRALRFPGERDREVRLALGELISYLEFEILNHPKLDDPEEYLEDVAPLRAQI